MKIYDRPLDMSDSIVITLPSISALWLGNQGCFFLLAASPDFSQDFYCGAAMLGIDCVALGLAVQTAARIVTM